MSAVLCTIEISSHSQFPTNRRVSNQQTDSATGQLTSTGFVLYNASTFDYVHSLFKASYSNKMKLTLLLAICFLGFVSSAWININVSRGSTFITFQNETMIIFSQDELSNPSLERRRFRRGADSDESKESNSDEDSEEDSEEDSNEDSEEDSEEDCDDEDIECNEGNSYNLIVLQLLTD